MPHCFCSSHNQNYKTHTHNNINLATVETIQCHKLTMIERQNHHYNIIIRHKMVIFHSSQSHHRNRKIIDQWYRQAMEMQPTEIFHQVNGTHRYVWILSTVVFCTGHKLIKNILFSLLRMYGTKTEMDSIILHHNHIIISNNRSLQICLNLRCNQIMDHQFMRIITVHIHMAAWQSKHYETI